MIRKTITGLCLSLITAFSFIGVANADEYENWVLVAQGRNPAMNLYARSVWGVCDNVEWRISNTAIEYYTAGASVKGASYQCTDGTKVDIRSPFREYEAAEEGLSDVPQVC